MRPGGAGAAIARGARHLPALLGVVLLVAAIWAVQAEFHHLQLAEIGREIRAIPPRALVFAFAVTVLAYFVLTLYDKLGTIYAGHPVSFRRVAFASFCAYTLSHNLGFAALSGAAVRYRLYAHWGLSPVEIAKTIAFCSLTFGLGGMALGGAVLIVMPARLPYVGHQVPPGVLIGFGALLWAIVAGYVIVAGWIVRLRFRGHEIELPGLRLALLQVVIASADVAVTASILWVLLPPAPHLTWPLFLGIYIASFSAGLLANLPGGLGVFDTALLFGLSPYLPASRIVAAIAVFRLFYYVIPLFLAGTLFAGNEILLRGRSLVPGLHTAWAPRWSEPDFAAAAASGAVALSGVMLLGLSLFAPHPSAMTSNAISAQASEFVPSLIGAGLIVMALGLLRRVTLAWFFSLFLMALGAGLIAAQGERIWPIGVLALSILVLAPFRTLFYRRARVISGPLDQTTGLSLLALAVCGVALAGFRKNIHAPFWAVVLHAGEPWGLRASVAVVVALALIAAWLLLRPGHVNWRPWGIEARVRILMLGANPPERADGLVYGEAERAAIVFRRLDSVLLGIGDPVGAAYDRVSAIWRLSDLARQEGRHPAFWRVGPELLKVYNDLGLTALPLGPDGLPARDPAHALGNLYLVCAAERDLNNLLAELPAISRMYGGETERSS
jgi:uncharacterized membrane protein YbhN (UPF0104 family)